MNRHFDDDALHPITDGFIQLDRIRAFVAPGAVALVEMEPKWLALLADARVPLAWKHEPLLRTVDAAPTRTRFFMPALPEWAAIVLYECGGLYQRSLQLLRRGRKEPDLRAALLSAHALARTDPTINLAAVVIGFTSDADGVTVTIRVDSDKSLKTEGTD